MAKKQHPRKLKTISVSGYTGIKPKRRKEFKPRNIEKEKIQIVESKQTKKPSFIKRIFGKKNKE